jgi:biopolymer transport protein ExbD
MKSTRALRAKGHGVESQMTPMIDIVFLLLIFFILSFRVVANEGDFDLRLPNEGGSGMQGIFDPVHEITVRLEANEQGDLTSLLINGKPIETAPDVTPFESLHTYIRKLHDVGPDHTPPNYEVEFDCDERLHYVHLIDAVTAVSGYPISANGKKTIVPLVKQIRFAK